VKPLDEIMRCFTDTIDEFWRDLPQAPNAISDTPWPSQQLRIADGMAAVARRVPIDRQDKEQWGVRSGFQDFLSLRIVCQHLPDEIVEASQWCRQATNVLFLLFSQQPSSLSFPVCRV